MHEHAGSWASAACNSASDAGGACAGAYKAGDITLQGQRNASYGGLRHASARAQTRLMAQEKGESAVRYRGLLDALVRIPREEGVAALWRGLLPRLMRIPPGQARAPHGHGTPPDTAG